MPASHDGPADRQRQALVVRGGWEGHIPVEATDLFIPFLQAEGFAVRVESDPEVYADQPEMAACDLVLQCYSAGTPSDPVATASTAAVAGLRAAVAAGTGLAGWHGGIAHAFPAIPEYIHLVGGQFACHPARDPADPTDYFVTHTIEVVPEQAEHPVVRGLGDFELCTEQYWMLTDAYVDVLATTTLPARPGDPWHRPVTSPAVWTRAWGKGRVFVATPGHSVDDLEHPSVRTIIERGLLWASRGSSAGVGAETTEPGAATA